MFATTTRADVFSRRSPITISRVSVCRIVIIAVVAAIHKIVPCTAGQYTCEHARMSNTPNRLP